MYAKVKKTVVAVESASRSHSKLVAVSGRICSSCGKSSTPLWRNGPLGPKTLCNACGVRDGRKASKGWAMQRSRKNLKAGTKQECEAKARTGEGGPQAHQQGSRGSERRDTRPVGLQGIHGKTPDLTKDVTTRQNLNIHQEPATPAQFPLLSSVFGGPVIRRTRSARSLPETFPIQPRGPPKTSPGTTELALRGVEVRIPQWGGEPPIHQLKETTPKGFAAITTPRRHEMVAGLLPNVSAVSSFGSSVPAPKEAGEESLRAGRRRVSSQVKLQNLSLEKASKEGLHKRSITVALTSSVISGNISTSFKRQRSTTLYHPPPDEGGAVCRDGLSQGEPLASELEPDTTSSVVKGIEMEAWIPNPIHSETYLEVLSHQVRQDDTLLAPPTQLGSTSQVDVYTKKPTFIKGVELGEAHAACDADGNATQDSDSEDEYLHQARRGAQSEGTAPISIFPLLLGRESLDSPGPKHAGRGKVLPGFSLTTHVAQLDPLIVLRSVVKLEEPLRKEQWQQQDPQPRLEELPHEDPSSELPCPQEFLPDTPAQAKLSTTQTQQAAGETKFEESGVKAAVMNDHAVDVRLVENVGRVQNCIVSVEESGLLQSEEHSESLWASEDLDSMLLHDLGMGAPMLSHLGKLSTSANQLMSSKANFDTALDLSLATDTSKLSDGPCDERSKMTVPLKPDVALQGNNLVCISVSSRKAGNIVIKEQEDKLPAGLREEEEVEDFIESMDVLLLAHHVKSSLGEWDPAARRLSDMLQTSKTSCRLTQFTSSRWPEEEAPLGAMPMFWPAYTDDTQGLS